MRTTPLPYQQLKAEATPNPEMILAADVDLDLLKELHNFGSAALSKSKKGYLRCATLIRCHCIHGVQNPA